jgi:ribosomal subunit interface protein
MMKANYTGGNGEFSNAQQAKMERRFEKIGRLIDKKAEQEAHVVLKEDKRGKKAEVTVNYLHNTFVANGSGPAYFPALTEALDKLERQIVKAQAKLRDTKRAVPKPTAVVAAAVTRPPAPRQTGPRMYEAKVSNKPMNIDEAVLVALRKKVNYVAFRDAETEGISIVIQRADGNFDVVRT